MIVGDIDIGDEMGMRGELTEIGLIFILLAPIGFIPAPIGFILGLIGFIGAMTLIGRPDWAGTGELRPELGALADPWAPAPKRPKIIEHQSSIWSKKGIGLRGNVRVRVRAEVWEALWGWTLSQSSEELGFGLHLGARKKHVFDLGFG